MIARPGLFRRWTSVMASELALSQARERRLEKRYSGSVEKASHAEADITKCSGHSEFHGHASGDSPTRELRSVQAPLHTFAPDHFLHRWLRTIVFHRFLQIRLEKHSMQRLFVGRICMGQGAEHCRVSAAIRC